MEEKIVFNLVVDKMKNDNYGFGFYDLLLFI